MSVVFPANPANYAAQALLGNELAPAVERRLILLNLAALYTRTELEAINAGIAAEVLALISDLNTWLPGPTSPPPPP